MRALLFSLLFASAGLSSASARAQTMWTEDDFHFFQEEIFSPFFAGRKVADGKVQFETARRRAVPARFSDPKEPGTFRIFIVGESVAERFAEMESAEVPVEDRISGVWSRLLSGRRVEVVPAAVPSYDSARVAMVVDEVLEHEPDLIVVLTGNNENRDPGTDPSRFYLYQKPLRRFGWFLKLGSWLRKGLPPPMRTPKEVVDRYERNLDEIARRAEEHGVPLVLCALPRNLSDEPPGATLPLQDATFFGGWWRWTHGDPSGAEAEFRRYVALRPEEPFGSFYLGRALRARGRKREALSAFRAAAELAGTGIRPSMDDAARRVAARRFAVLADLPRAFERRAANGFVGSEFFDDAVHWHDSLNPLVNEVIADAVRAARPALGWSDEAFSAEEKRVRASFQRPFDYSEPAKKALLNAVWSFNPDPQRNDELSVEGFDRVRRWAPGALEGLLMPEGRRRVRGIVARNIWTGNRVDRLDGLWTQILDDLGEMYRRSGSPRRAVRAFDESLSMDGTRVLTRVRRGLARESLGDCRGARSDLAVLDLGNASFPELGHLQRILGEDGCDRRKDPLSNAKAPNPHERPAGSEPEGGPVVRPDRRVEQMAIIRMLAVDERPPKGPSADGFEYEKSARTAFGPYASHEAVLAYADAAAHGLNIESALRLAWDYEAGTQPWKRWLYQEVGEERIKRLVRAYVRFGQDTGFDAFFDRNRSLLEDYDRPISGAGKIQADRAILEAYAGCPIVVRDVVIPSPLLPLPTGANFEVGSDLVWIVGPERIEGGRPIFNWPSRRWDHWHEWAHSILDGYADRYFPSFDQAAPAGCPASAAGTEAPCNGSWRSCVREHAAQLVADRLAASRGLPRRPLPHLHWAQEVFDALSEYESNRERYPTLESFYAKLVAPVPGFALATADLQADSLKNAADEAYRMGRLEEAIEDYARAVQMRPQNGGFRQNYGVALIRARRLAEAGVQIDEAVRLSDRSCGDPLLAAEALSTRASLRVQLGRDRDAAEDLRRSLAVAPAGWSRRRETLEQLTWLGGRP